MDREEVTKENTQEQEFTLDDILREFGSESTAVQSADDEQPQRISASETGTQMENAESVESHIGDEVTAALAEQEQQKAAYKKELESVRRRNRREQRKLQKSKSSRVTLSKEKEKKVTPVQSKGEKTATPKIVKFSEERSDKAPVNPTGKTVIRRAPLKEITKKEKPLKEPAPAVTLKQCTAGYAFVRIRCFAAFIVSLIMGYLSVANAFSLPQPSLRMTGVFLIVGQIIVMALCTDVILACIREITKFRVDFAFVVFLSNIISLIDSACFLVKGAGSNFPYSAISAGTLMLLLWSTALGRGACAKALKTIASEEKRMVLTREDKLYLGHSVIVKSSNCPDGFVTSCISRDVGKNAADALSCVALIVSCVAAGVLRAKFDGLNFLHMWSCILCVSLPFASAVVYTLPFSKLTKNLRRCGAVIGGYEGAAKLSSAAYLNITDHDLFGPGQIELNGMKLVGTGNENIISYTAAMMNESGCSLAPAFDKLSKEHFGTKYTVDGFRMLEGGMEGRIQGDHVVCGTGEFMRINAIPLPKGTNVSSAVFTAVNGELRGIFAITYKVSEKNAAALDMLMESNVSPLITSRDFNITPAMIRAKFDVDTDDLEMPYVDNSERIINADMGGTPNAVITKTGAYPVVAAVLGSKKLIQVVRGNIILMLMGSIVALALSVYLFSIGQTATLTAGNVLLFMIVWFIPPLFCSGGVTRY